MSDKQTGRRSSASSRANKIIWEHHSLGGGCQGLVAFKGAYHACITNAEDPCGPIGNTPMHLACIYKGTGDDVHGFVQDVIALRDIADIADAREWCALVLNALERAKNL